MPRQLPQPPRLQCYVASTIYAVFDGTNTFPSLLHMFLIPFPFSIAFSLHARSRSRIMQRLVPRTNQTPRTRRDVCSAGPVEESLFYMISFLHSLTPPTELYFHSQRGNELEQGSGKMGGLVGLETRKERKEGAHTPSPLSLQNPALILTVSGLS
jgi:hypothetical protein